VQVKSEYLRRFGLVWLPPLGFNDTFAMVVRKSDAERLPRATLTDAGSRPWRLGVGYDFLTRTDGLQSLNATYHLQWKNTPKTMDLGLLYRALEGNQVDMAAANSTDGTLGNGQFVVLQDDRKAFPPYSACFVMRKATADEHANVTSALSMLSNQISEETMQRLNRQVDIEHKPVVRVVHDFLSTLQ
jgi:glycine betaine/choline ABC-type transport system substrate-binding protein